MGVRDLKEVFDAILPIITLISGFLIAVFAEPLRRKLYKPVLSIWIEDSADCIYKTSLPAILNGINVMGSDGIYIRAKVKNEKKNIAKKCRAFLVNIEKKQENKFQSTTYCDSIPLAWSCHMINNDNCEPIDIPHGVVQYLDILSMSRGRREFYPAIIDTHLSYRYKNLFEETGTFRFTIHLTGENVEPQTLKLILEWNGVWDQFKVYPASKMQ